MICFSCDSFVTFSKPSKPPSSLLSAKFNILIQCDVFECGSGNFDVYEEFNNHSHCHWLCDSPSNSRSDRDRQVTLDLRTCNGGQQLRVLAPLRDSVQPFFDAQMIQSPFELPTT